MDHPLVAWRRLRRNLRVAGEKLRLLEQCLEVPESNLARAWEDVALAYAALARRAWELRLSGRVPGP